jgi:hypothetical protein
MHRWASLPMMGVVNNTIRASEAFFTYVTSAKRLMKIYVPFVTPTAKQIKPLAAICWLV